MASDTIIKIEGLEKSYKTTDETGEIPILKGIDLEISSTDFVIVYGASGSGKSTLLHHIVGLEMPTKGNIWVRGTNLSKLSAEERAIFRSQKFGMVYQFWYWAKSLNVVENVAMPLFISGMDEKKAMKKAMETLAELGMEKYANKLPIQLSGGEQQRVCIARALVNNPWILVADEPTGNLDTHNADAVISLFQQLNVKGKRTIIMVTHNLSYLPVATRTVAMKDGKVISKSTEEVKQQIRTELQGVL